MYHFFVHKFVADYFKYEFMKIIVRFLILASFLGVFMACSSDEDPTFNDIGQFVGNYNATRIATIGTAAVDTNNSYPVYITTLGSGNEVYFILGYLKNTPDILDVTVRLSNFRDRGEYVTFDVEPINKTNITYSIPDFFQKYYANLNKTITELTTFKMNVLSGGKFVKKTKEISFTYTGSYTAKFSPSGSGSDSFALSYYMIPKAGE